MISLQIELFLLMLVGFLLAKKGILTPAFRSSLSTLALTIFLPASIIRSFEMELSTEQLLAAMTVLVCACGIQVLYSVFAHVLWKKESPARRINLRYGTLVSNAGFMGMPVAQGLFGDLGLLYAAIFLIPQRIVMWSAGLSLYTEADSVWQVIKKVLTHPCIVAIEIGLVVFLLGFLGLSLPLPIEQTLAACAGGTTAVSMIVIGGMLADADKHSVFTKTTLAYSFVRLVLLPGIIAGILFLLPVDGLSRNVCILLSAMPAASTTGMLAQKYDKDPAFAGQLVFVSTLLSLVTLPVWCFLLQV